MISQERISITINTSDNPIFYEQDTHATYNEPINSPISQPTYNYIIFFLHLALNHTHFNALRRILSHVHFPAVSYI